VATIQEKKLRARDTMKVERDGRTLAIRWDLWA
jgi:hypothetical protein